MNREPTLQGVASAWRIARTPEVTEAHRASFGYEDSGIDQWLVQGPYHPLWSWWMVACVHLRDVAGAPPAHKRYPAAEYEFVILSINPEDCDPDVEAIERGDMEHRGYKGFLEPADVVCQFDGVTDEQARGICEDAVHAIVAGRSCDSDFRTWWEQMIARTVMHVKAGVHD